MKRDLQTLTAEPLDVLVMDSGIYGAFMVRLAALQGLRTGLIERADFASAASSNGVTIAHGGLRHLRRLSLGELRRSVRARRELMRLAPHLLSPLPCVTPVYGWGTRPPRVAQRPAGERSAQPGPGSGAGAG